MSIEDEPAIFSDCRRYRYWLRRRIWQLGGCTPLVGTLLNPSKASREKNDPTTTFMVNLAARLGFTDWIATNLNALVDTYPSGLLTVDDPVGPENDLYIRRALRFAKRHNGTFLIAWGNHGVLNDRAAKVMRIVEEEGVEPMCFGITKQGQPRFPRALPSTIELMPWRVMESQ